MNNEFSSQAAILSHLDSMENNDWVIDSTPEWCRLVQGEIQTEIEPRRPRQKIDYWESAIEWHTVWQAEEDFQDIKGEKEQQIESDHCDLISETTRLRQAEEEFLKQRQEMYHELKKLIKEKIWLQRTLVLASVACVIVCVFGYIYLNQQIYLNQS